MLLKIGLIIFWACASSHKDFSCLFGACASLPGVCAISHEFCSVLHEVCAILHEVNSILHKVFARLQKLSFGILINSKISLVSVLLVMLKASLRKKIRRHKDTERHTQFN